MIERHWKGIAKREKAKEYITHLQNDTFKQIAIIPGFVSARILERDTEEGIEFLIITAWQNVDAIKAFAGPTIETAVVPKLVQDIMVTYDSHVRHYKIDLKIKAN